MNNKLILFDIDDTLFDNHDYKIKSRNASLNNLRIWLKKDYKLEYSFDELNSLVDKIYRKDTGNSHIYDQLLYSLGLPREDVIKLVVKCVMHHHNTNSEMIECNNVKTTLKELKNRRYTLGICSSGKEFRQWDKLVRINIEEYFDTKFVFITGKINNYLRRNAKDLIFYKKIKKKIKKIGFSNVYMVGNKFRDDVLTSYHVGFESFLVKSYSFNEIEDTFNCFKITRPILNDLSELLEHTQ
ncbi:MAG: HAD hydrolase-like protein [Candidatus Woesearchaeota archaeon]|jgi:putative hydrolase of the HAD superfamily|nr:HAD hydrolase-like protein [Candidatus Woesearchaeota archaeon]